MDQFSYLSVLLSIILGLAITQVLKGFRGMLLTRARVRFYWPTVMWSCTLLLIFVQSWWAMFYMRNVKGWTFPTFSIVVLQTIVEYMLGAIVLPDFFGTELVDLHEHYYAHRRLFFGLVVLLLVISLGKSLAIDGQLPEPVDTGFQLWFMAVSALAIVTGREWFHRAQAIIGVIGTVAYIVVLFLRLR
jgi:hypothetical protein